MSSHEFAIAYDGPALEDHTMDVQTLGPALLAVGDMCREANRVMNGQEVADINVRVKATAAGCFDILFEFTQIYNALAELIQDEDVATAKDIIEWLGFSAVPGAGLLAFLKWKRGRKIVKQEAKADGDGNAI